MKNRCLYVTRDQLRQVRRERARHLVASLDADARPFVLKGLVKAIIFSKANDVPECECSGVGTDQVE